VNYPGERQNESVLIQAEKRRAKPRGNQVFGGGLRSDWVAHRDGQHGCDTVRVRGPAWGWMKFLGNYGLASGTYWMVAQRTGRDVAVAALLYYVLVNVVLAVLCRGHVRLLREIGNEAS